MSESKLMVLGVGRRLPDDALFAAGDRLSRMYVREGIVDIDDEQLCHQIVAVFPCEVLGCTETFSSLLEFEMHYNSCHRFICSQCRKPLPTAHLLDLHLSESHDSFFAAQAERKPMFRCFVEDCSVLCQNALQRRSHCIDVHNFPHDFRYDQSLKKSQPNRAGSDQSKMKSSSDAMVVDNALERKTQPLKQFTFGHSKRGKSLSKASQSWHTQGKKSEKDNKLSEITTKELMETLPT